MINSGPFLGTLFLVSLSRTVSVSWPLSCTGMVGLTSVNTKYKIPRNTSYESFYKFSPLINGDRPRDEVWVDCSLFWFWTSLVWQRFIVFQILLNTFRSLWVVGCSILSVTDRKSVSTGSHVSSLFCWRLFLLVNSGLTSNLSMILIVCSCNFVNIDERDTNFSIDACIFYENFQGLVWISQLLILGTLLFIWPTLITI